MFGCTHDKKYDRQLNDDPTLTNTIIQPVIAI